jgi:hypothetical protein
MYTSHLTSGKLTISLDMQYTIVGADKAVSRGNASSKVVADSFFFQKTLNIQGGRVSWKTQSEEELKISNSITLEWSEPKLPYNYKQILEDMLKGDKGSINFKQKMLVDLNSAYKVGL